MADNVVEVRLVARDALSPVFAQAAQNAGASLAVLTRSAHATTETAIASWRGMLREIDNAEAGFVRNVLTRRQSLSRSLLEMAGQLVESEIASDLRYFTNYALLSALGLDIDRRTAQQGLLAHLFAESQKTTATTAGVAARSAAETTGAGTSLIAQVGAAIRSIAIDAGQTFAGIFAFLAPLMGPAAAGPAAAGESAVYAAAGSISAFAVGAWEIPQDMAGILHAGEAVMPASFASGFRATLGGGNSGGASAPAVNVTFAPQVSALDAKSVLALFNNPAVMRPLTRNLGAYLAANPSVRGSY
ncbi:MAG: hypothetical protein ACREFD_14655 [Stellaceae bacterium]